MALEQRRVCSFVLKEAFGHEVEMIGAFLLSNGPSTLPQISKNVSIERNEVRILHKYIRLNTLFKYYNTLITINAMSHVYFTTDKAITPCTDSAPVSLIHHTKT